MTVDLSAALTAGIADLTSHIGLDADGITESLRALDHDLGRAVASYVGLQLSLTDHGQPVTFAAFRTGGRREIGSSLHLPLSTIAVEPVKDLVGQTLTFYAGTPGAFVDLAADLSHVLHLPAPRPAGDGSDDAGDPPRVQLDQHLTPSSTTSGITGLADASVVNRAVGFELGQGCHPDDVHQELMRRATAAGSTVVHYATQLIRPPAP